MRLHDLFTYSHYNVIIIQVYCVAHSKLHKITRFQYPANALSFGNYAEDYENHENSFTAACFLCIIPLNTIQDHMELITQLIRVIKHIRRVIKTPLETAFVYNYNIRRDIHEYNRLARGFRVRHEA